MIVSLCKWIDRKIDGLQQRDTAIKPALSLSHLPAAPTVNPTRLSLSSRYYPSAVAVVSAIVEVIIQKRHYVGVSIKSPLSSFSTTHPPTQMQEWT